MGTKMPEPRLKILIMSVGSLLGQNLLDSLETRRHLVQVMGVNSKPDNPRIFRCDQAFLLPALGAADFESQWLSLLQAQQPDLILPGRDDDVVFLARFREQHPEFASLIPCGASGLAEICRDKYATYLWAQEQELPFAHSFVYTRATPPSALRDFVAQVSYPLIAKPRQGFGSQGVYLVMDDAALAQLLPLEDLLFQEYLEPRTDLSDYQQLWQRGLPLFFQIPESTQYSAQTLIPPSGELADCLLGISTMVHGRCELFRPFADSELEQLLRRYARVFYAQGWRGPLNLQCKRDRLGQWQVHEINLRMTGGTSARLCLGYDEIGTLMQHFYPRFNLPNQSHAAREAGTVYRVLMDQFVPERWVQDLARTGQWQRSC